MPDHASLPAGAVAVLADIHANIDALDAVLTDLSAQGCGKVICLGDTIGYGPEPAACLREMRVLAAINLMGNHETMFLATNRGNRKRLHRKDLGDLWPSIELCHQQLGADETTWIARLPFVMTVSEAVFVHGSLHEPPAFGYIINQSLAKEHFGKQASRLSFYGHTHIPAIWQERSGKITRHAPSQGLFALEANLRYAIGVGSVGQPRDDDTRACYVIYRPEAETVEFRRVRYDIETAQARFQEAGLSGFDTERIAQGG